MQELDLPEIVAPLDRLIGVAREVDDVNRELTRFARASGAAVVGAHQITCSDESERKSVESFHEIFVRQLLPELKYWSRSSFRTANLGGRYELGSLGIAEDHYAAACPPHRLKLLVTKISSHVSVDESSVPHRYGRLDRYERESVYCGALHAVLEDQPQVPAFGEIEELFGHGSVDRLEQLRDPAVVDPNHRALFAAIAHAQLQGERIVEEARALRTENPTLFLVVTSVTLNRTDRDMELTSARWVVDRRGARVPVEHRRIGTDPARYRIGGSERRLEVHTER